MIISWMEKSRILVTCAKGIAPFLRKEIISLGLPVHGEAEAAVETEGNMEDAMRLNLCLRTGQRVLFLLHEGRARTPEDLYAGALNLPWEDVLHVDGYVCITSSVDTPEIRDPRYANVKVKDAVVDRLRRLYRRRPDSGPDRSGAVIHLYWQEDRYRIFADTSGEPLSRRGYRKIPMTAPMQETLAAAVLMATGWTGEGPLVNPMCGSGTLAVEAALIARRRAPGLLRDNFGFLHLQGFDDDRWQRLRLQVRKEERKELSVRIIATDIDPEAVRAATINAGKAKVERNIRFRVCPFAETPLPQAQDQGIVVINPPYGQRLGEDDDLGGLYKGIGDFFKDKCRGYGGYIFTANPELAKKVGLRTTRRIIFFNGELESRLLEYEIYSGSKKHEGQPEAAPQEGEERALAKEKRPPGRAGQPKALKRLDTPPAADAVEPAGRQKYARILPSSPPPSPRRIERPGNGKISYPHSKRISRGIIKRRKQVSPEGG